MTRSLRRDRRGRGLRGPLAPPGVPLVRTRSQRFDALVLDAVSRLEQRWEEELRPVEFAVEDVPVVPAALGSGQPVPLGRFLPPAGEDPPRVVVYRRPLESRASDVRELGELVQEVVTEQVAELLGVDPTTVDPDYGIDEE